MARTKNTKKKSDIPVRKDMPDYSKDPYFIKKAERATAFLTKNGLPLELIKKLKG